MCTFAIVAVLLFAIDLYGVVAQMTHSRRRAISVWIAMRWSVRRVIGEVLLSGLAMFAVGLSLGAVTCVG